MAGGRTHGLVRRLEHVEIESLQWYWNDADFNLLATEVQQYRQEGLNIRLERVRGFQTQASHSADALSSALMSLVFCSVGSSA